MGVVCWKLHCRKTSKFFLQSDDGRGRELFAAATVIVIPAWVGQAALMALKPVRSIFPWKRKPSLQWSPLCREMSGGFMPRPAGLRNRLLLSSPGRNHGHWDLLGLQPGQLVPSLPSKIQFPSPWRQDNQRFLIHESKESWLQLQVTALQVWKATLGSPGTQAQLNCIISSSQ